MGPFALINFTCFFQLWSKTSCKLWTTLHGNNLLSKVLKIIIGSFFRYRFKNGGSKGEKDEEQNKLVKCSVYLLNRYYGDDYITYDNFMLISFMLLFFYTVMLCYKF